jgi:hypothetical protein
MISPLPVLDHVWNMTDGTAMFEHAWHRIPKWEHGYCVDDNARLLLTCARFRAAGLDEGLDGDRLTVLETRALGFVRAASVDGCPVRTRIDHQKNWIDEGPIGDTDGRVCWALGEMAAKHSEQSMRTAAGELFSVVAASFTARTPRSVAFAVLGAAAILSTNESGGEGWSVDARAQSAARLLLDHAAGCLPRPDRRIENTSWPWIEPRLTYANAAIPDALIAFGAATGDRSAVDDGLFLLEWLVQLQWRNGHFSFTPHTGWGPSDNAGQRFDQQPIEATAMADACLRAWHVTGDPVWAQRVRDGVNWFLGGNDTRVALYDPVAGACTDGLREHGVNPNCGAESTLVALMAMLDGRAVLDGLRAEQRKRVEEFAFADGGRPDTAVRRAVDQIDRVVIEPMNSLHEHDLIDVARPFPGQLRFHDRRGQDRASATRVGIEEGDVHRVDAIASSFVEEQQEAGIAWDRWRPSPDTQRARCGGDDHVVVQGRKVFVPEGLVGRPERLEVVEDGDLHVGMNAMHERDPAVGEIEDHRVLVRNVRGAEHDGTVLVHNDLTVFHDQPMRPDLPRATGLGMGEVCRGHDEVIDIATAHRLNARILDRGDVAFAAQQHAVEAVVDTVVGHEAHDVADVVEKSRASAVVAAISGADPTCEQHEPTVVMEQARIEDRLIPGGVTRLQQRLIAHATRARAGHVHVGALCVWIGRSRATFSADRKGKWLMVRTAV